MVAYQSLYRRYRPARFSEIKAQDHVVTALRTAVRDGRVAHAYMLHGPRGTGKTTTARVLAKALNCENLGEDGEPCCECESCEAIASGRSFDLHELDAASNNKVDDMRALLERVNLATPGRAKVYLLDEVHMLTTGAENALLKTLEEPPGHVTWVLATTEPHKVAQTIRSRCQVFELGLVNSDIMDGHVREIASDAGLEVSDDEINHVLVAGAGSVRDTLTALDRVVAGGGTVELDSSTDAILAALADGDAAAALAAVGDAVRRGRNERTIGEMVLAGLRDAFLTLMGDPPARLSESEQARAKNLADRIKAPAMTRAMETLGRALIDMRQAPDPRVDIEVALIRLCRQDGDLSLEGLNERLARLEERTDSTVRAAPHAAPAPPVPAVPSTTTRTHAGSRASSTQAARAESQGPAREARRVLSERRSAAETQLSSPGVAPDAALAPPPPPIPAIDIASLSPQTPSEVVELAQRHLGLDQAVVVARAKQLLPEEARREPSELKRLWRDLLEQHGPASHANAPAPPPVPQAEPASDRPAPPEMPSLPSAASLLPPVDGGVPEVDGGMAEDGSEAAASSAVSDATAPGVTGQDDLVSLDDLDALDELDAENIGDIGELAEAPSHAESVEQHVNEIFPGAELIEIDDAGSETSSR